jgi:small conductance mechanosensitive channel
VQDILKSFFAGLYLLFERPFLIGDDIQVKEHVGRVEHIGFRATSIRTKEGVLVVVPNALFFIEPVQNRTIRTRAADGSTEEPPT